MARILRKTWAPVLAVLLTLAVLSPSWATTWSGDQAGADVTLANGDYVQGAITGVGTFTLPSGATVYVTPWNGSDYGYVEVTARNIVIAGTLDAQRAGYYGYPGGPSGSGGSAKDHDGRNGGAGLGSNQTSPTASEEGAAVCDVCPGCTGANAASGADGLTGKGTYAGTAGTAGAGGMDGSPGTDGGDGGYQGAASNGDSTTTEAVARGSGAGGGGGGGGSGGGSGNCNGCGGASGGAGASGGRGGAYVKLSASESLIVSGSILTKGGLGRVGTIGTARVDSLDGRPAITGSAPYSDTTDGTGLGGSGALGAPNGCGVAVDHDLYSAAGGAGGDGSGGGVLLISTGPWPLAITGTIDARGGGNNEVNFGSAKIFGVNGQVSTGSATFYAGWDDSYGSPYNPQTKNYIHPVF